MSMSWGLKAAAGKNCLVSPRLIPLRLVNQSKLAYKLPLAGAITLASAKQLKI